MGRLLLHDFSYGPLTLRVIEKDKTRDIQAPMDEEVNLRGSMIPPPQTKHQAIYSSGKTHVLNDEFNLVPDTADGDRLVLVHLQKHNEPVLGEGDFDYRYFSTKSNSKALLQVRHGESGTVFFFDFDGTFFPKGIPMIPKDNMEWLIESNTVPQYDDDRR